MLNHRQKARRTIGRPTQGQTDPRTNSTTNIQTDRQTQGKTDSSTDKGRWKDSTTDRKQKIVRQTNMNSQKSNVLEEPLHYIIHQMFTFESNDDFIYFRFIQPEIFFDSTFYKVISGNGILHAIKAICCIMCQFCQIVKIMYFSRFAKQFPDLSPKNYPKINECVTLSLLNANSRLWKLKINFSCIHEYC